MSVGYTSRCCGLAFVELVAARKYGCGVDAHLHRVEYFRGVPNDRSRAIEAGRGAFVWR